MSKKLDSTYVPKVGESKASTAASLSRVLQAVEKRAGAAMSKAGGQYGECARKNMHP